MLLVSFTLKSMLVPFYSLSNSYALSWGPILANVPVPMQSQGMGMLFEEASRIVLTLQDHGPLEKLDSWIGLEPIPLSLLAF